MQTIFYNDPFLPLSPRELEKKKQFYNDPFLPQSKSAGEEKQNSGLQWCKQYSVHTNQTTVGWQKQEGERKNKIEITKSLIFYSEFSSVTNSFWYFKWIGSLY